MTSERKDKVRFVEVVGFVLLVLSLAWASEVGMAMTTTTLPQQHRYSSESENAENKR